MSGVGLLGWAAALTPTLSRKREREEFTSPSRAAGYCPLSRLRERAGVRAQPHAQATPTRSKAP